MNITVSIKHFEFVKAVYINVSDANIIDYKLVTDMFSYQSKDSVDFELYIEKYFNDDASKISSIKLIRDVIEVDVALFTIEMFEVNINLIPDKELIDLILTFYKNKMLELLFDDK